MYPEQINNLTLQKEALLSEVKVLEMQKGELESRNKNLIESNSQIINDISSNEATLLEKKNNLKETEDSYKKIIESLLKEQEALRNSLDILTKVKNEITEVYSEIKDSSKEVKSLHELVVEKTKEQAASVASSFNNVKDLTGQITSDVQSFKETNTKLIEVIEGKLENITRREVAVGEWEQNVMRKDRAVKNALDGLNKTKN